MGWQISEDKVSGYETTILEDTTHKTSIDVLLVMKRNHGLIESHLTSQKDDLNKARVVFVLSVITRVLYVTMKYVKDSGLSKSDTEGILDTLKENILAMLYKAKEE